MTCCPHCTDAEDVFAQRTAKRDLRRYLKKGPRSSTRLLLDSLRASDVRGRTLLDVGGGVGTIQHELIPEGLSRAAHVDASSAYLRVSEAEAARRGYVDRMAYHHGDVVELAPEIPPADIVVLDRVICCYPDLDLLVSATAPKAERLYGLVFPRERWEMRLGLVGANALFRIRRSAFRVYLHSESDVDASVRRHGLERRTADRTYLWNVVTYGRGAAD